MHYTNVLGTDLFVEFSDLAIWSGGAETLKDGREAIVNMPTIEVFTTPILSKTEGIIPALESSHAVAYAIKGENGIVLAFTRGDKEINEAKLKKVTKKDIAPFSAEKECRPQCGADEIGFFTHEKRDPQQGSCGKKTLP